MTMLRSSRRTRGVVLICALALAAAAHGDDGPNAVSPPYEASQQRADAPARTLPAAPEGVSRGPDGPIVFPQPPSGRGEARARLARQLADPGWILLDGARFDPILHGEPDLSAFVPRIDEKAAPGLAGRRLALVQFFSAPGAEERALLAASGATPLFYVPNRAYLVRADEVTLEHLRRDPRVRWIGRHRPGYKIDASIARLSAGLVEAGSVSAVMGDVLVVDLLVVTERAIDDVAAAIAQALPGVHVAARGSEGRIGIISVELPVAALSLDLARLAAFEEVIAIEGHGRAELLNDDAVWIGQSYDTVARQNYPVSATIWKQGLLGEGEIIGVADSGADPDTCWLDDPLGLPPVSEVPAIGAGRGPIPVDPARRKIIAYNLLGSQQASATAYDVRSGDAHGTWIAVAAAGDNLDHPADEADPVGGHHDPADGMAPLAKLVIEDLGDDEGELVGLSRPIPRLLDQMFEQMRDAGARISTNSWGVEGNQYDLMAFFTDRMAYNHPDFLMLFSAGNGGPLPGSIASPATAKNVVTVGASEARIAPGEGLDPENIGEFSARGPTSDGRLKPDLVISGSRLVTGDSDLGEVGRTCDVREVSGTSFATPVAAGFAALAREYFRKGFYPTGTQRAEDGFVPSAALLKASLIAGARSVYGRAGEDYGPCIPDTCDVAVGLCRNVFLTCDEDADCSRCDANFDLLCGDDRDCDLTTVSDDSPANDQGWGRLHLDDVLYFAGDARGLAVWDVPRAEGVATGETWAAEFHVDGTSEELQIVLTWPDPPALVAAPTFLVNDLDLRLTAPDGTVFWGNAWAERDRSPFTREYTTPGEKPLVDVDTVEAVRLAGYTLTTGIWKVEVVGDRVPGSPLVDGGGLRQDFAVVAVGPVSSEGGVVRLTSPTYACGGDVVVEVLDSNAGASVSVSLETLSGDTESLVLPPIGGGLYRGSMPLASGTPMTTSDGTLSVTDSETIRARYDDVDPVLTSEATASVHCVGAFEVASVSVSGGCDDDAYLDAGESVSLQVELRNTGTRRVEDVVASLSTSDSDVFVEIPDSVYGTLEPGETAAGDVAYRVSLRTEASRSTRTLALDVGQAGSAAVMRLELTLPVETDEQRTPGSWSDGFESASLTCHDGSSAAPTDAWYFLDPDEDCESPDDTWQIGLCLGEQQAMFPSCLGTWDSTANEIHHRLVSPQIPTGDPETTTIIEEVRFRETYELSLNEDGLPCDRTMVELFTNRDGRLLPTGYYRDRSAAGDDESVSLDITALAEYSLPPTPDGTLVQLIFHAASNEALAGSTSCTGSSGDEYRWRVDDVELVYENVKEIDDASVCEPGCTSPQPATGVTVTALGGDQILVGWDPSPDADHYDVYRRDGAEEVLVGRVAATQSALVVLLRDEGSWSFDVEAVDASGLCPASRATSSPFVTTPECSGPPDAVTGLVSTDDAASDCQLTLTWDPVTAPCGGPVAYRIHRSLGAGFSPDPSNLLAETSAASFVDDQLTTGYDDAGEPTGDVWHYAVIPVDTASGLEGDAARVSERPGGPRQSGTWLDDAGDTVPLKMRSETILDELEAGAGWSQSPFALRHSGAFAYWSDPEASGDGRYEALSCIALTSPAIELDPLAAPRLDAFVNYEIEAGWDGLVFELAGDDGLFAPIEPLGGYPGSFASTVAPPCQGSDGGTGEWINACDYPPSQGAITGPEFGELSGWEEYSFDLTPWAGETIVFRANLSSDCGTDGGAILDDLSVSGALLPTACAAGGCLPAPRFAGLLAATDADPAGSSGIELSWGEVADWGGGGPGTFDLYRDGELIATLASSERDYVDANVEANRAVRYRVVARSGAGCALPSEGAAELLARDCGPPAAQDPELDVSLSPAGGFVILRTGLIAGAGAYRFPWSQTPEDVAGSADSLESQAPEARHEVAEDGLDYFYLAEGVAARDCP